MRCYGVFEAFVVHGAVVQILLRGIFPIVDFYFLDFALFVEGRGQVGVDSGKICGEISF